MLNRGNKIREVLTSFMDDPLGAMLLLRKKNSERVQNGEKYDYVHNKSGAPSLGYYPLMSKICKSCLILILNILPEKMCSAKL